MEILEKLKPTKLKDVVGNRIQIKRIVEVLKNEAFESKIVLIIGPDGCGKSLISKLIFDDLNFNVLHVSANIKDIQAIITSFVSNKTIMSFFDKKRKIVFMDNIDILLTTERNVMSIIKDIYSLLEKHNVFLVATCKNNEEKKLLELKNKVEPIKINYPSIKDTFAFLSQANDVYSLGFDEDELLSLVNKYRGSIRDVVISIGLKDNEYDGTFKDLTQFEIIKSIMRHNRNMSEIMNLLREDVSMVSFLLYENLPDEVWANFSKPELIEVYKRMNEWFVIADVLETFMYQSSDWSLYDYVHLLKLFGTSSLLEPLIRNPVAKDVKYRFSQIISKVSHKNIMNKKAKGICNDAMLNRYELMLLANVTSASTAKKLGQDENNYVSTYLKYFE